MQSQRKKTQEKAAVQLSSSPPRQRPVFSSGIPLQLKQQAEEATGLSFDDVRVHYNSGQPEQIQALAYTQGNQVYLGPGQEHCLPHELGHVIQQKTGRVQPDSFINGLPVNTNPQLEQEADSLSLLHRPAQQQATLTPVVQGYHDFKYPPPHTFARYHFGYDNNIYNVLERDSAHPQPSQNAPAPQSGSHAGMQAAATAQSIDSFNTNRALRTKFTEHFAKSIIKAKQPLNIWDINYTEFCSIVGKPNYPLLKVFSFQIDQADFDEVNLTFAPVWIEIPDYATGDQFTLAAMLLQRPNTHVLVVGYSGAQEDCQMLQTFEQTLDIRREEDQGRWILGPKNNPRVVFKSSNNRYRPPSRTEKPSYATKTVGENYNNEWKTNLRTRWGLPADAAQQNHAISAELQKWISSISPELGQQLPQLHEHNLTVLWLRHSGEKGGAHLEHDTGTAAMLTLIDELLKKDPSNLIILAGDKKYRQLTRLMSSQWAAKIFDFTEFWKNTTADPTGWGGNTRMGQIRFYDYLKANARSLRHIGSRSGNLELMALIGHDADYIEEMNSFGGNRMVPFNRSQQMHYKRVILNRPPTFKGSLVRIVNYLLTTNNGLRQHFTTSLQSIDPSKIMDIGKNMAAAASASPFRLTLPSEHITKQFLNKLSEFYVLLFSAVLKFLSQSEGQDFIDISNLYAVPSYQMNILYPLIVNISKQITPMTLLKRGINPDIRRQYRGFAPDDIQKLL